MSVYVLLLEKAERVRRKREIIRGVEVMRGKKGEMRERKGIENGETEGRVRRNAGAKCKCEWTYISISSSK